MANNKYAGIEAVEELLLVTKNVEKSLSNAKQNKLTAGANITIADDVISAAAGGGLWNVYCFVGGSADSVVTIDGASVTVAAGATVQGSFTADISAIPTNNLRRIIIRGDVSLSICTSTSAANSTLEEVDVEFSPSFVRSLDYFCYNLRALRRLRVAGGQPSGAQYMCRYVGLNTDAGCLADLHDIDFSAMTSSNGCRHLCSEGKWESVDLSGSTFGGDARYIFYQATVGSADVSGCTFNDNAYWMFYQAAVQSADVSGCTFNDNAYWMFYQAAVQSADVSGSTFGGSAGSMFYYATIKRVSLAGADLSAAEFSNANTWVSAEIDSLDLDGITLPTDGTYCDRFVAAMNSATKIGTITGDWGEYGSSLDLSALDLRRNSTVGVFNALGIDGGTLEISDYSGARVTDYDIAIATNKGWTVAY